MLKLWGNTSQKQNHFLLQWELQRGAADRNFKNGGFEYADQVRTTCCRIVMGQSWDNMEIMGLDSWYNSEPYLGIMILMTPKWLVTWMGIDQCPQFHAENIPEVQVPTLIIRVYDVVPPGVFRAVWHCQAQVSCANRFRQHEDLHQKIIEQDRSIKQVSSSMIPEASPDTGIPSAAGSSPGS